MTERVTQPSEADAVNWATGGSAYSASDPGSGKRDIGFQPKDEPVPGAGEVIPAETHNWLWKTWGLMISWVRDFIAREWSDLDEGIDDTVVSQRFLVYPPITGNYARGAQAFSQQGQAGAVSIKQMATDGRKVYYYQNATGAFIRANNPDGSVAWSSSHSYGAGLVATDGEVVVTSPTSGVPSYAVQTLEASTGATRATGGASNRQLDEGAVNGYYFAARDGNLCWIYSDIHHATAVTEDGSYDHTAALTALAINHDHVFIGGVRAADTFDVRAIKLSTRTATWSIQLPNSGAPDPTIHHMCTDGDLLFIVTDRVPITGGNASVWCLSTITGTILWTADPSSITDTLFCGVDDRWVYVTDDNDNTFVLDKRQGWLIWAMAGTNAFLPDGVGIYGTDGANNIERYWRGGTAREFVKTDPDDVNRAPFFHLAVPKGHEGQ